jgi:hypothetical protein
MRRVNARITNSCFWILLLHLSPSCASRIALDERVKRPRTDGGGCEQQSDFRHRLCGKIIEKGYVRDLQTRLIYCDTQCFPGEADMVMPVSKNRARKES